MLSVNFCDWLPALILCFHRRGGGVSATVGNASKNIETTSSERGAKKLTASVCRGLNEARVNGRTLKGRKQMWKLEISSPSHSFSSAEALSRLPNKTASPPSENCRTGSVRPAGLEPA